MLKQDNKINTMIEENLGLARFCANRFKNRGIEYDDIFQVACVGLVKAANTFDITRGFKFSTYAVNVIFGEIKQLFRSNSNVSISRNLKDLSIKITKIREIFLKNENREPILSELSEILEVDIEKILEALEATRPTISFESEDTCLNFQKESNDEIILQKISMNNAMKKLSERDKIIINLRFFKHMTQTQTAQKIGSTQVQVSRREKVILNFLRKEI